MSLAVHPADTSLATGLTLRKGRGLRLLDWIWQLRGTLPLPPGQSSGAAIDRLEPLFHVSGTSYDRGDDVLTFVKKDQAAQDKMSIFDGGVLRVETSASGLVLRYRVTSKALLFCFLAPFLFIAFGQLTVALGKLEQPAAKTKKDEAKKERVLPQHWIDQALGAPAPEKPKDKKKADEGPSPMPAYVFAGLFAALYIVGRWLEHWLVRRLFRRRLEQV